MLSTLERHILRRLVGTFVPMLLGASALFGLGATLRLLRISELTAVQVALLLPWVLPFLLPILLPLAYAASVALVFGRMVADQEVLAYLSLGIPRRALARPALLLAVPLTLLTTWLGATVVPHAYQRRKEATKAVFEQFRRLGEGEHLSHTFPEAGFGVYVRRHGPGGLEGVVLYSDAPAPPSLVDPAIVVARRGVVDIDDAGGLRIDLTDVTATIQRRDEPTGQPLRAHLDRWVQRIRLPGRRSTKENDYSTADLRARAAAAGGQVAAAPFLGGIAAAPRMRGYQLEGELEIASRVALAGAPLLLTWIVANLTFLLQARSALAPLVLGLGASAVLFFLPMFGGRSVGEQLGASFLPLAGPVLCALAGFVLARAAERPSDGVDVAGVLAAGPLGALARRVAARLRGAGAEAEASEQAKEAAAPEPTVASPAGGPRARRWGVGPTLDVWLLGQFVRAWLAFAAAVLIVAVIVDFATQLDSFRRDDVSFAGAVAARYGAFVPELFFTVGPLLGVVAAAWVVISLLRTNALLALYLVGYAPRRLAVPFLVGGALLSGLVWLDREHVLPWLGVARERTEQQRKILRYSRPIPDGERGLLVAGAWRTRTGELQNLRYVWFDDLGGEARVVVAPVAAPDPSEQGVWRLTQGGREISRAATGSPADDVQAALPPGAALRTSIRPEDIEAASDLPLYRSSRELRRQLRRSPGFAPLEVQLHEIKAGSLAAFALLLAAVPIALGRGRGDGGEVGRVLLTCVVLTGGYFVVATICVQLGGRGVLPAAVAAYAPACALGLVGAWSLARS